MASDPYVIFGLYWVEDTREIYTLRGPQLPVLDDGWVSGPMPPVMKRDAYEVTVLGRMETRERLARAMDGWEDRMTEPDSLQWARHRLDEALGPGTA